MNLLSRLAPLLLAAALALPASHAAPEPLEIVIGAPPQSFHAVTAAVVQEVLESLEHEVKVVEAPREECFELLAKGEVDLLVAAWLPGTDIAYWRKHQGALVEVTTLYAGARLLWAVPAMVPQSAVQAITDLLKAEVRARMQPIIRVGPAGSGLAAASEEAMRGYALTTADYRLEIMAPGEAAAAFLEDYAQHRWAVIPLTQPHWLHRALPLRALDDPRGALGDEQRASLLAGRGAYMRLPERSRRALERIHLDAAALSEMDYAVNVDNRSPRQAAREWMERNAETVRDWTE